MNDRAIPFVTIREHAHVLRAMLGVATIALLSSCTSGPGGDAGSDAGGGSGICSTAPTETIALAYQYPAGTRREVCLPLLRPITENFVRNAAGCSFFSTVIWAEQSATGIQIDTNQRVFAMTGPVTLPTHLSDSFRTCPSGSDCAFMSNACNYEVTQSGGEGSEVELQLVGPCMLQESTNTGTDAGSGLVTIHSLVLRGRIQVMVQGSGPACP